jgi:hypothetical protein
MMLIKTPPHHHGTHNNSKVFLAKIVGVEHKILVTKTQKFKHRSKYFLIEYKSSDIIQNHSYKTEITLKKYKKKYITQL